MAIKRIMVTGYRNWTNKAVIYNAIMGELDFTDGFDTYNYMLIQGECPVGGADEIAKNIALDMYIPVLSVPAKWEVLGKGAGPIRNEFMVNVYKPDVVLAFIDTKSKDTVHAANHAESRGIPVKRFYNDTDSKD